MKVLQLAAKIAATIGLVNVGFLIFGKGWLLPESLIMLLIALMSLTTGVELYADQERGNKSAYAYISLSGLIVFSVGWMAVKNLTA
ncbi:hypothetical protein KP77_31300 [Jeotgalibacillus alimentarius]|uniref:DUF3953 domain-containing protein n=1 Tax=Jeotgalibacillus alimentarius TaxID=135826 RepID=A0A0C2RNU2_9BACL|nr:hypothetical protein [Jeotgalibacillus alimentarius]KIL43424.1 hypothetical protein KP77_31300 [Jeotgalibacillus alimentarius]